MLLAMSLIATPIQAQRSSRPGQGPVSHHAEERNDEEYRMSHLEGDAGDLIGLVLPRRFQDMDIKSGKWEPAETDLVKVTDYSKNSAKIRLLREGTTVVDYKYKYMVNGKEESVSYPFTIRIYRVEPETVTLPSTLYLGWDVIESLSQQVQLQPMYSQSALTFNIEDPTIADITYLQNGTARITGRRLGESVLHVETSNGLHAEARVLVQIPELRSLDITNKDKRLDIGEQMQLEVKISPARAQPELQWYSENPDVVSVDDHGVVTAHKDGKTTIRVVSGNGVKDSITIKVRKD